MERHRLSDLIQWIKRKNRKPLVIRGARQVGKTWLVRALAKATQKELVEINFEYQPEIIGLFNSNNPHEILLELSAHFGFKIHFETHILFLDEIQVAPNLLAKLRWFAELMPELPVLAAGSLLEFVLADHQFSMPVGRINYMHVEPLSFVEFLLAQNKTELVSYLYHFHWGKSIPKVTHDQCLKLFREYLLVGGLPEAIKNWIDERSFQELHQIQRELLATYRDDFSKYSGRLPQQRLEETMQAIPRQLGNKFVYSNVNPDAQSSSIKLALDLISKAKLAYRVDCTAANGIPLGAELNTKHFKIILLDVGLVSNMLGLNLNHLSSIEELTLINKGALAEQVVGQMLRTLEPYYTEPALYYWQRLENNAQSEVDYIIQHGQTIIPVEVKAGTTGSLKSLHYFMHQKKLSTAVRINSDLPSRVSVAHKSTSGEPVSFTLLSIPFYLVEQLPRLLGVVA